MSNIEGELEDCVRAFFRYLDITEESDSGRVFHPVTLSSCRIGLNKSLDGLLLKMKELSGYKE